MSVEGSPPSSGISRSRLPLIVAVVVIAVVVLLAALQLSGRLFGPPNEPPDAEFFFFPASPAYRQAVTFLGSASKDPDGTILSYAWQFGDNTSGEGFQIIHTYAGSGTYTVTLGVTDDDGATASRTKNVTVSPPPPLRAGTSTPFPPFEYWDLSLGLVGFDIDLTKEIAERFGRTVEWVDYTDFSTLLDYIDIGVVDLGASAITSSGDLGAQRNLTMHFSAPYFVQNLGVLTNSSDTFSCPGGGCAASDLDGIAVGVAIGAPAEYWAAQALDPAFVRTYASIENLLDGIRIGTTRLGLVGDLEALGIVAGSPDLRFAGIVYINEQYSFAFPKTAEGAALRDEFDTALEAIVADGTYLTILARWF